MTDAVSLPEFVAWLHDHNPDDVVGFSHDAICNPIATYLRHHDHEASVAEHIIIFAENPVRVYNTPYWATMFLGIIDGESPDDIPITTADALHVTDFIAMYGMQDWIREVAA